MIGSTRVSSAAGGRWVPAKPTMSYNSTGKFNITNFSANNNYVLVPNSGTATVDSNGVVTLSATTTECTVAAKSPKGTPTATALIGRAAYTYTYSCGGCASAYQDNGNWVWVLQPYTCCSTNLNGAPSGYSGGSSEWQRIVN